MISKGKRAIRKEYTSVLVFHFWDLKIVPINSALNSASDALPHFFKNVEVVPRKTAKLENPSWIFSEMSSLIYSCKTGKCFNLNFLTGSWTGIVWVKNDQSNFDSNFLTSDFTLLPGKNSLNIAKSSRIFGNGRGDKTLILIYFGRPSAEVFPHYSLFSSILTSS